jgi:pyruvate,water dikinase
MDYTYSSRPRKSTGIESLDDILDGLRDGDNVVWRLDRIAHYRPFTHAFLDYAKSQSRKIVYFRFGGHEPVLPENDDDVIVERNNPELGFEDFITRIHATIRDVGVGGYFVFDALSDLNETCYSDRMIGNFFQLTCPYLLDLDTIAYFSLYRHRHSYHAVVPIYETTQILLDVYEHDNHCYLQPQKVYGRDKASPYTLFRRDDDRFIRVDKSAEITAAIDTSAWVGLRSTSYRMAGLWDRTFMRAENVLNSIAAGDIPPSRADAVFKELVRLILPREERIRSLAARYLTLSDLIDIWKRMIGTGMIGGKSTGMLLARAIIRKERPELHGRLEHHDSFFVGSDVFYTFLVTNHLWWDRQRQKDPETFLTELDEVRRKMMRGSFPDYIVMRLEEMLEYFGRAPIIVRSSSLLEDNFGNAFSGKYESVFCANQGSSRERLDALLDAIRTVYASTMSRTALTYRKRRDVLERDEQMSLLVQRVSGAVHSNYFFPQLAGVLYSFNPYVWSREIDPDAGVIRLVFGLGTRAVDRADDDYTRVVALNAPGRRPESSFDAVKRHTQRRVDVIDLENNRLRSIHFQDLVRECQPIPLGQVATRDRDAEREAAASGMATTARWVLTFDPLLAEGSIVQDLRQIVEAVRGGYETEVDIEFTANTTRDGAYAVDIVQCRPFLASTAGDDRPVAAPEIPETRIVLQSAGAVIGQGRQMKVDRIVYVSPEDYTDLPQERRYALARLIGKINRQSETSSNTLVLIGPGRWGSSTPALGIPVSFSEISNASVLVEVDALHEGLVPDLSLGTHFFNDMVEVHMLYVAHYLARPGNRIDWDFLAEQPSVLGRIVPETDEWKEVVRVIEADSSVQLILHADSLDQTCVLYTSP